MLQASARAKSITSQRQVEVRAHLESRQEKAFRFVETTASFRSTGAKIPNLQPKIMMKMFGYRAELVSLPVYLDIGVVLCQQYTGKGFRLCTHAHLRAQWDRPVRQIIWVS